LKEATRKLTELEENFREGPGMIGEGHESLMAPVAEVPDRSGEAPAEFEEYRQDLWKLAENRVTIEDHVNKWRSRKVKPRHDKTVKKDRTSVAGETVEGCRFRVGQWLRHKTGILEEVKSIQLQYEKPGRFWICTANHFNSASITSGDDMTVAMPKEGEWWKKLPCPRGANRPDHPAAFWTEAFKIGAKLHFDDERCSLDAMARCGCLVPQNFGRSKEPQGW
jgi:hypothetical protein